MERCACVCGVCVKGEEGEREEGGGVGRGGGREGEEGERVRGGEGGRGEGRSETQGGEKPVTTWCRAVEAYVQVFVRMCRAVRCLSRACSSAYWEVFRLWCDRRAASLGLQPVRQDQKILSANPFAVSWCGGDTRTCC